MFDFERERYFVLLSLVPLCATPLTKKDVLFSCLEIPVKHVTIFKKPNSPYWYLASLDSTGKRVWKSTKVRVDDVLGRKRVLEMAREKSVEAKTLAPVLGAAAWENWAPQFLTLKYRGGTLQDALGAWKALAVWLHERKLVSPSLIQYHHAADWIGWRTSQKRRGGKLIRRNTALSNLKYLNLLMREAVRRGFASSVPTERLNLRLDPQPEKPEITDAQDRIVREALKAHPAWMSESYQIAMAQGCRLREVEVSLDLVDEKRGVITFRGKGNKVFATKLNPVLKPLVERARAENRPVLVTLPKQVSLKWANFFQSVGMKGYCFHCTRVTVVTKLARSGVPIQQAMAFVGHANSLIHRIYQRLLPQDLQRATDALGAPPSPGPSGHRP